ncbi:MAG: hypothetical protein ACR2NX_11180, partial [Chthoniobacterales bacterium]
GCQPAFSGSLPETVRVRTTTYLRSSLRLRSTVATGCRDQQAGSLRYPEHEWHVDFRSEELS